MFSSPLVLYNIPLCRIKVWVESNWLRGDFTVRDICTRSVVVELKLSKNYCPSKIFARLRLNHCIVGRALKKVGSLRIGQNDHLGPHFPKSELFQMKIFEIHVCVSFTFFQIFGTSWKHTTKLIIFAASISQVPSSDLGTSWPQALKQSFKYLERAKKNANIFRF